MTVCINNLLLQQSQFYHQLLPNCRGFKNKENPQIFYPYKCWCLNITSTETGDNQRVYKNCKADPDRAFVLSNPQNSLQAPAFKNSGHAL